MLSNGGDIYRPRYTDCVLAARSSLIEQHPEDFLGELVGPHDKTSLENARIGAQKQPPCVDQRAQTEYILGRVESIIEMGYIKIKPGHEAIDWTFPRRPVSVSAPARSSWWGATPSTRAWCSLRSS